MLLLVVVEAVRHTGKLWNHLNVGDGAFFLFVPASAHLLARKLAAVLVRISSWETARLLNHAVVLRIILHCLVDVHLVQDVLVELLA